MPLPPFNIPPAYMGFVGFVRFNFDGTEYIIRAKSAEINVKQDITKPDVIDSRYDRTVYQLGPKEIDGSIEFPAVYDAFQAGKKNLVQEIFNKAVLRDYSGLLSNFDVDVKYAASYTHPNKSEFTYQGCIVNSFNFSVAKQDVVNVRVEVMGINRVDATLACPASGDPGNSFNVNNVNTARAVTWNDARVEIEGQSGWTGEKLITGEYVRSFDCTINNNANRFYTLNGQLSPQSVAPTKRDITGKIVLMGRHISLANQGFTNENRSAEDSIIRFGYVPKTSTVVSGKVNGFGVQLPNVVFQIEEMALTNDIFETTINWHSLPAASQAYDYLYEFNSTFGEKVNSDQGFAW